MTLYFRDRRPRDDFVGLCKSKGLHGTIKRDGAINRDVVTVTGFKNKTARTAFTSLWAAVSLSK